MDFDFVSSIVEAADVTRARTIPCRLCLDLEERQRAFGISEPLEAHLPTHGVVALWRIGFASEKVMKIGRWRSSRIFHLCIHSQILLPQLAASRLG